MENYKEDFKNIRETVLNHMSIIDGTSFYETPGYELEDEHYGYYDEDGHCGEELWNDIKNYWMNFDSLKELKYVVSGEWVNDFDLEGGRDYILSSSGVYNELADFLSKLGYDSNTYPDLIYNSCELTDNIEDILDGYGDKVQTPVPLNPRKSEVLYVTCIDNKGYEYLMKIGEGYELNRYTHIYEDNDVLDVIVDGTIHNLNVNLFEPLGSSYKHPEAIKDVYGSLFESDMYYLPVMIKYDEDKRSLSDSNDSLEFM